jgi:quercetin dioxygenase-like cupin family protein
MEATIADLLEIASSAAGRGPVWTHSSEDLNVNLLRFGDGEGVPEHVNAEVDVLLVGIDGEGTVLVDGEVRRLRSGQACIIPKGARRAIWPAGGPFVYLSCHRRRGGLWPG